MFLLLIPLLLFLYAIPTLLPIWRSYRYRKSLSALIPGDEGLPLFGIIFKLGRTSESMPRRALELAKESVNKGEKIFKMWIMHDSLFIPMSGELLQSVFESNDEITKGADYDILVPWLGTGLLISTGDKWRSRRKMLTPTFHFSMLDGYVETMNRHAKILIDSLDAHVGQVADLFPLLKLCTLDIICEATMGKELGAQMNPNQPYVSAIAKLMFLDTNRQMLPHLWSPLGRWATGWQKEHDKCLDVAHKFTVKVIHERIDLLSRGKVEASKRAFLDLLISQKESARLSMEDIREEVDTFMFEGHDTTTSGLSWTLWCLATHPEAQEKVFQELNQIFGDDSSRDCTREDLGKMHYTERCIKEALRLFPPVPFALRQLQNDMHIVAMRFLLPAVLLSLASSQTDALKFLVYNPLWGRSHVNFMGKMADVLVEAGHEVVMLAPIIDASTPNVGSDKVQKVIKVPPSEASIEFTETVHNSASSNFWRSKSILGTLQQMDKFLNAWIAQCNTTINHPGLLESLKDEKFDAAITEPMDMCGYGIFRRVGIDKVAATLSIAAYEGSFDFTGLPSFPSYVPGSMMAFGEKMNFFQRVINTLSLGIGKYFLPYMSKGTEDVFRANFGDDFADLNELTSETSLWFYNTEPLIEFPRPILHKIIDVGGISVSTGHNKLNQTWSDIMNLRSKTVLLSFGTVAKSYLMPEHYKQTIREVFKKFPDVTFIWKYEKPEHKISEGIPNLIEATWVPQNDMLYDSRLSLFITHCGQGSTTEATTAGVPLIVIPILGDQLRNAAVIKRIETGLVLDKEALENSNILEKALRDALHNEKYRTNAHSVGEMIRNRPFSPRETFVRNMEFLAHYGPLRMLDHYGRELNFIQYYLIDVFAFLAVVLFGEHLIPKDASLCIAPWLVHRNENLYGNPHEFDPDNFLPDKVAARHPYDYFPFSAGPRNCIGQRFAMYEEKIIISWIIRHFRLESSSTFQSNPAVVEIILKPKNGVKVELKHLFVANFTAFIPITCLLYFSQVAPLHNNCRYILCVWSIGFGVVFAVTCYLAVMDLQNESGYMPLNMFKPPLRLELYQWHVRCTIFCSTFEIALSMERMASIIRPRRYHFSSVAWIILIPLTLVLMIVAYEVDLWVHSADRFVEGLVIYAAIEISVLITGSVALKVCRDRYESIYGKCSLTERYQVKEAYEMSRAMIPAYITSFILKVSMISLVCLYFSFREEYGYTLGYLHLFYFTVSGFEETETIQATSTEENTEKYFSMMSMSSSSIFVYFNEHPIIPVSIIVINTFAFIPLICLLYFSQMAPLHSNCRYILSVWTVIFGAVYIVSLSVAKLDLQNETGYMPLYIFNPAIRFTFYRAHIMCTTFCSSFEIALSIERIAAIIKPRSYHFAGIAWKSLFLLTALLMTMSYVVDSYVHSENQYIIGCSILFAYEISIVAAGSVAVKVCGSKYERMYGKSSLTARYQVNEAYDMSKAMIPTYITSFILKNSQASMIIALCAYLMFRKQYGHFLGYLHAHYFITHAINGSFAMIILLLKHRQLRKHIMRKFRCLFGCRQEVKVSCMSTYESNRTEVHFSMLTSVVENVTVSHHDEPLSISSLPPLAPLASCLDGRFYVFVISTNSLAFLPMFCLLYIAQSAPLHNNSRPEVWLLEYVVSHTTQCMEIPLSLPDIKWVKEAYEMSKAMIPAYITSFLLKASSISVLSAYFLVRDNDGYLTGFVQGYVLMTHLGNGTFSKVNLLLKHPQLFKQADRKFRLFMKMNPEERKITETAPSNTKAYVSLYSASWK
ncbi:hypothetical protein PRIPAC_79620 [Pristionchus pacificus]|uniref:Glucuronosyltransferase n=1 Tax=Pristionchus pacificus TaxID=54126 RepID=A0A2A6C4Q7_PRIPA|nr:hypothetical protein PRIPAC_79620 [Pristionchus pacificus]|eukprot:PDM73119.1 Glycosyltransferase [Pristionchus pacificus]